MISPAYVRTMADYNAAMNERLYAAAARLNDEARKLERGAFWGSIQGTLNHLLWSDRMWMSRFDGWEIPQTGLRQSGHFIEDFAELADVRTKDDARISAWSRQVDQAWLDDDLTWFSTAVLRELTMPSAFLAMHLFNHQTHHRGQAHALITAAGQETGDTDLFIVLAPPG